MPTNQTPAVLVGQEYETCQPIYWLQAADGTRGPVCTRIRVVSKPVTTPGLHGFGKVEIETVTASGRGIRRRRINVAQLHATGTVGTEELPRKSGYRLVQHADGSAT